MTTSEPAPPSPPPAYSAGSEPNSDAAQVWPMDDLHWMWVDNLGVWAPTPALLVAESEGRPVQPQPCSCVRVSGKPGTDGHDLYADLACWACDGTGIPVVSVCPGDVCCLHPCCETCCQHPVTASRADRQPHPDALSPTAQTEAPDA